MARGEIQPAGGGEVSPVAASIRYASMPFVLLANKDGSADGGADGLGRPASTWKANGIVIVSGR